MPRHDLKGLFLERWATHFPGVSLPLALYYTDKPPAPVRGRPRGFRCVFSDFRSALRGPVVVLDAESVGCPGGRRYLGFSKELRPDFEYFLSCGKEGLEGERYKKSPELVRKILEKMPTFEAPAPFLVLKRFDLLSADETPEVVAFFGPPDVISALFTLANFDRAEDNVRAPFGSGCSTVVMYPYLEASSEDPKCILGSFDISARPLLRRDHLSFAIPFVRFCEMVENMDESFLVTRSWERVKKRL